METINIIEALNLRDIPSEDQERIREAVLRLIRRRVAVRIMKELGFRESGGILDRIKKLSSIDREAYFKEKVPNHNEIAHDEAMIVLGRMKSYARPPITVSF